MQDDCTADSSIQVTMNTIRPTRSRGWLCVLAPVAIAACGDVPRAVPDAHPAGDAAPGLRAITVQRSHGGSGTVTSSVGGITCGTTCTASVADGTSVTLTAAADPGSTFSGWSGPCTGSEPTCSFKVSDDVTVGAAFDVKRYTVTVALAGPGVGTVTATPGSLSCPGMCSMSVDAGSVITLTAAPAVQLQSKFVGWGTPMCSGTAPCVLPINGDQTITAIFTKLSCGNGVPEPGEECDDGNPSNNDGCTNACTIAKCGDGFQWFGHEDCDDGNTSNNDACTNTCKMAQCGDGFQWLDHEECDAGTANSNSGACTSACKNARCGDHLVWAGHEGCDDGSTSNDGDCLSTCVPARCGDGFQWLGHERCDDGNLNNSDHCDNNCHCGGLGQVCCDTGSPCDTGNGCLQGICTACPASPVTTTRYSTSDSDGNNQFGVNNLHHIPLPAGLLRCSDGNHHDPDQCIVTPIDQPGGTSCTFEGWINPNDPGDCGCNVRFITPADSSKRITCSITIKQTTNSPPHPDGCQ